MFVINIGYGGYKGGGFDTIFTRCLVKITQLPLMPVISAHPESLRSRDTQSPLMVLCRALWNGSFDNIFTRAS